MELNQNQNNQEPQEQTLPVEQETPPAEQNAGTAPKMYSEDEFNAAVDAKVNEALNKKIPRREAKIRKEYSSKYGELEEVLMAGTGEKDIGKITASLKEYYQSRGKNIPQKPQYSDRELQILARAEAEDIISSGHDEVVEEVDRLAKIGIENMSAKDKALFQVLATHRKNTDRSNELAQIGVGKDIIDSDDFKAFASKFVSGTPAKEIYELYSKTQTQPQKEIKQMGSMKNTDSTDNGVKDFYTPEEAKKFTKKDLDNNPALFEALQKSMRKWKK